MFDIWFTCHECRKCRKCCPHTRKFCRSNLSRITSTRDKQARIFRGVRGVSYLIILTTKFVKLPILWSQISPCRPRKQILLNFFLGLSGRCHHAPAKASSSTPPDIYPPPRTKIRLWRQVRSCAAGLNVNCQKNTTT